MATPVTTVASGGLAVVEVTAYGMAVTEDTRGIAVTKVTGGKPGLGVTYVSPTGGPAFASTAWSASDKTASITLSNGNLTATSSTSTQGVRSAGGVASGKYYFEVQLVTIANITSYVGVALSTASLGANNSSGASVTEYGGTVYVNNGAVGVALGSRSAGNFIGIAVDRSSNLIWYRVAPAGNWNASGTANPATGAGGVSISTIPGTLYAYFRGNAATEQVIANFGASAFSGAVPSGFTAGWPA